MKWVICTVQSSPNTVSPRSQGVECAGNGNTGIQFLYNSFTGYSEGLPAVDSEVCTSGEYARKHSPWTDFTNLASTVNQPFSAFPTNYANLPTMSFVIPNLHDPSLQIAGTSKIEALEALGVVE